MVILHAFLALAAGLAAIVLLDLAATALVARFTPSWAIEAAKPEKDEGPARFGPGAVTVHLGALFLSAAAGGYLSAWMAALFAAANPLVHVLGLAIIVLTLGALNALQSRGKLPIWLQLSQVALSPIGVLAGGLLRLRVLGIL